MNEIWAHGEKQAHQSGIGILWVKKRCCTFGPRGGKKPHLNWILSLLLCTRPSVNHTLNPEKKKAFVIWGKSHSHNFTCDTAVSTESSQRGNRSRIKGFNWSESQQGSANDLIPQRVFVTALHRAGSKVPLNSNSSQREEREVEVLRVQTKTLWKALLPFSMTHW